MEQLAHRVKILWRFLSHEWKASFRELWLDLRAVRWIRVLLWLGALVWLTGIALGIAGACIHAKDVDGFCMPDGSFSNNPSGYNIWKTSGFFQITLGFGHMSFAIAKFIDITFDIVAGRGGQAVLALISYQTIKRYITSAMEESPISYGTYRTLFLRDSISFTGLIDLVREFSIHRPLSSSLAMTWMILSACFVILFPTLVSAMSGYSANGHAFILDSGGNYMDYQKLFLIDYVIHNASRVNFTYLSSYKSYADNITLNDTYIVKRPKDPSTCNGGGFYRLPNLALRQTIDGYDTLDCTLRLSISEYVREYGFFGLNQTNSTFLLAPIPSPSINITAYYIDPSLDWANGDGAQETWGTNWTDPQTGSSPFNDSSKATYTTSTNNETFVLGDSTTQGKCQPDVTYKWGFSFLLLFICLIILLVWTTGTYILWLKARLAMRHHEDAEIAGEYKAVIELASAMNNEFGKHGENPGVLRERQIRTKIKQELNGGTIMYHSPLRGSKFRFREGLKRCWIRDKWWILASAISLFCAVLLIFRAFLFGVFSSFVTAGILVARLVGQTKRSRVLILVIFLVSGLFTVGICSA